MKRIFAGRRETPTIVMGLLWLAFGLAAFSATVNVEIRNFYFTPTNIVIQPGDTVVWKNTSFTPHDTTQRPARVWASPVLAQNDTFSFTFNQPGAYSYVCAIHIAQFPQQTGLVVVAAANIPPTVAITNPSNGAVFAAPATFTVGADARDSDGTVSTVEFFVNGNSAGISQGPLYSAAISGLDAGNYTLTAVATDNQGATTPSIPVNITVQAQPSKFPLSTSSSPQNGGSMALSPAEPADGYLAGTVVSATANPADGFSFTGWSGDANGTQNPLNVTVDRAKSITANFQVIPTVALVTTVTPSNGGSVRASPPPNATGARYTKGSTITLTATAAEGFSFSGWSGDASGTQNPLSVTLDTDKNITAQFSPIVTPTFSLTTITNPPDSGTIQIVPAPNAAGGTYVQGTPVTLTAAPSLNFAFTSWIGDAISTTNPITIILDADKTVTANFVEHITPSYTLTLATNPAGAGRIQVSLPPNAPDGKYYEGTEVTLTALATGLNVFTNWSGDASGTSNSISIVINSDKSAVANFIETITPAHTLTLITNPPGAGAIDVSPPPNAPDRAYFEGTLVTLTARPIGTNSFTNWSGATNSTAAAISIVINADETLTANFAPIIPIAYALTISVTPTNAGTVAVTPQSSNGTYSAGALLALAAQPNPGFRFVRWSGQVTSTNNPIPLIMDGSKALTAEFEPARTTDFALASGVYTGLLLDASATNYTTTGLFAVRLSRSGAYRGTATIGGMREFVAGQFDRFGYAPLIVRRASLSGSLQIVSSNVITGVLTDYQNPSGQSSPALLLYRPTGPTNIAALAGDYDLQIEPQAPVIDPGTIGMQIMPTGKVRLRGELGDHATVAARSFVSNDGHIPVFVPLYHSRGVLAGWLNVGPEGVITGDVIWFRPPDSRSMDFPTGFVLKVLVSGTPAEN